MQKKNKILMIAVSSLLCLTLISSCLVSSVFARYVTKDSAEFNISFIEFNPTLGISVCDFHTWGTLAQSQTDLSVVEFTGTSFKPGEAKFQKMIRARVAKTSKDYSSTSVEVDARLKIYFNFELARGSLKIPAGIGNVTAESTYIPVGVYMYAAQIETNQNNGLGYMALPDGEKAYKDGNVYQNKNENYLKVTPLVDAWQSYTPEEYTIEALKAMVELMDFATTDAEGETYGDNDGVSKDSKGYYVYKDFKPNDPIVMRKRGDENEPLESANGVKNFATQIFICFEYPFEYGKDDAEIADYDEMLMYLSDGEPTFNIKYGIALEQIKPPNK